MLCSGQCKEKKRKKKTKGEVSGRETMVQQCHAAVTSLCRMAYVSWVWVPVVWSAGWGCQLSFKSFSPASPNYGLGSFPIPNHSFSRSCDVQMPAAALDSILPSEHP